MTVRPPEPDDASAIRSLQTHLAYPAPELVDAALDGPFRVRVATDGGRVVGYAIALPGRPTVLAELVVAQGHRRAGHASALLEAVTDGPGPVEVTTPVDNDAAIAFYEARGFEVEKRCPDYYDDGSDALRLVRGE